MPTFNNMNSIYSYIERNIIKQYLLEAVEKVEEVIKKYIQERFYNMYEPTHYQRTYQLLNSVTHTDIKVIGNTYEIIVYLDTDGVNYNSYVEGYGKTHIDPQIIFDAASEGYHGTVQTDGRFMEEAKDDLINGKSFNIFEDFKKYLSKNGIRVINQIII